MSNPPKGLTRAAKAAWRDIVEAYDLDDRAALMLLEGALTAWDRMRAAADLVARDGLLVPTADGSVKQNPAITIERDSRAAMVASLKSLNLDLEPLKDIGQPPSADGFEPTPRKLRAVS